MTDYSNENNVQAMMTSVDSPRTNKQGFVKAQPKDTNPMSSLDNIKEDSSVMRMRAVHLSMCHPTISQRTDLQVSTHYVTMSEVGRYIINFGTGMVSFSPTSFYYNGVIPYVMSIIQRHRGVMI